MLQLLPHERRQAFAYRDMVRRARKRSKTTISPAPKPQRGREIDRGHKHAVSQLFCIASYLRHGIEIRGVHVAHLRFSNASPGARNPGLQRKPDDRWTLPLSPPEHRLQHAMSELAYWRELRCDPHALAAALHLVSPRLEDMEAVLKGRSAVRLVTSEALAGAATPLLRLALAELVEDEKDDLIIHQLPREEEVRLARRWREIGVKITALAGALIVLLGDGEVSE